MIPAPRTSPAALTVETVRAWTLEWTDVERRLGARLARWDARRRAGASLRGLRSPAERNNGWQVAAGNGEATPYGVPHLFGRAGWDVDAVRADWCAYVIEHLGAPPGVLVLDETGLLNKGRQAAGVARPYSGPAGRVAHCQIGVWLAYARAWGHAVLDRAWSRPKEWTQARARCPRAGIPPERPFATQPALARHRLERAFQAGGPATWGPGDSV